MTPTSGSPKDIVRRLLDEVLTQDQADLADELVAPGFVNHDGFGRAATGPESIKLTSRMLRAAFPDLRFEIQDMIAEGDRVAVRWTMHGTHSAEFAGVPATGRRVQHRAIVIYRLDGGRLAEVWARVDDAGLLHQLRHDTDGAGFDLDRVDRRHDGR